MESTRVVKAVSTRRKTASRAASMARDAVDEGGGEGAAAADEDG